MTWMEVILGLWLLSVSSNQKERPLGCIQFKAFALDDCDVCLYVIFSSRQFHRYPYYKSFLILVEFDSLWEANHILCPRVGWEYHQWFLFLFSKVWIGKLATIIGVIKSHMDETKKSIQLWAYSSQTWWFYLKVVLWGCVAKILMKRRHNILVSICRAIV